VDAVFHDHPEIDDVLHAAAVQNFTHDEAAVDAANAVNVRATQYLADAAQASAQRQYKIIGFHMVSSINALMHAQHSLPDHPQFARNAYAQQKCDAVEYLKKKAAFPSNRLDIHVTYPMMIIGTEPDTTFVGNLFKHAHTTQENGDPSDIDLWLRPRVDQANLGQPNEMVRRANYVGDILSCFSHTPKPGMREYSIQPDYALSLGSMLRIARQVVSEKRGQTPDETLGEQMALPLELRVFPTPQQALKAPAHKLFDLRNLFAEKYDATGNALEQGKHPTHAPERDSESTRQRA